MLLFNYGCVGLCVLSVTTSCCIRTFEIIAVKQEKYRDREKIVPEKATAADVDYVIYEGIMMWSWNRQSGYSVGMDTS